MALTSVYVQIYGQLSDVFKKLREGQAPGQFSLQHLKDLGFTSSNYRAVIPLLKAIGFLDADGKPTTLYHEYRNEAQSRKVMATAVRRAYADIFVLKAKPTATDRAVIEGKFKSTHNTSPHVAKLMANTFFALQDLADLNDEDADRQTPDTVVPPVPLRDEFKPHEPEQKPSKAHPTLHYNIQIHLPATKDIEVFNAIFKSLKEHLLD